MSVTRVDRRDFLRLAGGLLAATATACGDDGKDNEGEGGFYEDVDCPEGDAGIGADAVDLNRPFADRVADARAYAEAYFRDGDLELIETVAASWLDEVSADRDEAILAPIFEPVLFIADTQPDAECAGAAFQQLVVSQFAALEFIDVGGWTMSEAELTLAALAAAVV